jgi:hypothetical protein
MSREMLRRALLVALLVAAAVLTAACDEATHRITGVFVDGNGITRVSATKIYGGDEYTIPTMMISGVPLVGLCLSEGLIYTVVSCE